MSERPRGVREGEDERSSNPKSSAGATIFRLSVAGYHAVVEMRHWDVRRGTGLPEQQHRRLNQILSRAYQTDIDDRLEHSAYERQIRIRQIIGIANVAGWRLKRHSNSSSFLHYLADLMSMESNSESDTLSQETGLAVATPTLVSALIVVPRFTLELEEYCGLGSTSDVTKMQLLRIKVAGVTCSGQSDPPSVNIAYLLSEVRGVINRAFMSNHVPPYMTSMERFPDEDAMASGLFKPDAVILALIQDAPASGFVAYNALGTIGLLPYEHPAQPPDFIHNPHLSWDVYIETDNEIALPLVIKSLAVDPSAQGRGIGRWMLHMCECEAIKLARSVVRSQVRLTLTTMMELNESFYLQCGWTTTRRHAHQPGYVGNAIPITAVQMEKVLEVN